MRGKERACAGARGVNLEGREQSIENGMMERKGPSHKSAAGIDNQNGHLEELARQVSYFAVRG